MDKTFNVTTESGDFICYTRTGDRSMRIMQELNRLIGGAENVPPVIGWLYETQAHLKCLILKGPDGWSLDDIDWCNPDDQLKASNLLEAIREAEEKFRGGTPTHSGEAGNRAQTVD